MSSFFSTNLTIEKPAITVPNPEASTVDQLIQFNVAWKNLDIVLHKVRVLLALVLFIPAVSDTYMTPAAKIEDRKGSRSANFSRVYLASWPRRPSGQLYHD